MFLNRDEAVSWMTGQRKKEIGFGSFQRYLNEQENHLDGLKILHVAGTNGKGSTVSMLMSCLMEAGYRVGTFTSPHLLVHEDRIRINGVPIDETEFLRICNLRKPLWEQYSLSMFEMDLDLASLWFDEQEVDFVILEAGIGGKADSTNVIHSSLASVIVSIGLDHMDRLGDTVEKIAVEKAGIIKQDGEVICGESHLGCSQLIQKEARKKNASFHQVKNAEVISFSPLVFQYENMIYELSEIALYQVHNACCAIETLHQLRKQDLEITDEQIQSGIRKAHWPGRFDVVSKDPFIVVDGAHNAHGIAALKESAKVLKRPITCVFACLKDKDKEEMIESLSEFTDCLILTEFDFYRAMKVDDFKGSQSLLKIHDWKQAIQTAVDSSKQGTVLITGSLYFISEVMTYFENENTNFADHSHCTDKSSI